MGCGSSKADLSTYPVNHPYDGHWEIDTDRAPAPQEVTSWSCLVRVFSMKDPVPERGSLIAEKFAMQWEWSGPNGSGKEFVTFTHDDFLAKQFSGSFGGPFSVSSGSFSGSFSGKKSTSSTQLTMEGPDALTMVTKSVKGDVVTLYLKKAAPPEQPQCAPHMLQSPPRVQPAAKVSEYS